MKMFYYKIARYGYCNQSYEYNIIESQWYGWKPLFLLSITDIMQD